MGDAFQQKTKPFHKPPEWTTHEWVERLSFFGTPNKRIAELLEIDEKTLVKHYGQALHQGREGRFVTLAATAHERALESNNTESNKLLMFILRTRGGWTETSKTEHSGPNGGPMVTQFVDAPPKETREEWLARRARELANPVAVDSTVRDDSD